MLADLKHVEIILYVSNQELSTQFYTQLLDTNPTLNVPGMTEFTLFHTIKLGLMPNHGIAKILTPKTPHPETGHGIPRCELYLTVQDIQKAYQRALECQAVPISEIEDRTWGDTACYFADPDGHILAFAQKTRHNTQVDER